MNQSLHHGAYLVVGEEKSPEMNVSFITAKPRFNPSKGLSIPRLEIQGYLMGSRMKITFLQELSITTYDIIHW